jgi:hypothetical protein
MNPPVAALRGRVSLNSQLWRSPALIWNIRTLINRAEERNILHYTTAGRKTHPACGNSPPDHREREGPAGVYSEKSHAANLLWGLKLRSSTSSSGTGDLKHWPE